MTAGTKREDASHAAKSGFLQVLTMLGQGLLPVQRMLVSRLFGQTAYGIYRAGADLCEVAVSTGLAGADKALLRFVPGHRALGETREETRVLGTALRLSGGLLLALSILLAVATPLLARAWGKAEFLVVLPALAPSIFAGGLVILLMAATLAAKVTRINLLVRGIGDPAFLLLATLVVYAVHPTVGGMAFGHLCAYLTLFLLAWGATGVVFGRGRLLQSLRTPSAPGFIRFALPLGASGLMNSLLQRLNVFILSGVAGAPAVAVFAAAEELGRSVVGVRYAFDNVLSPMLAESLHQKDRERARYSLALTTRWVASAAAPIAVTLFALRADLLALYGPGYGAGGAAMTLLLLGHLVNSVLGLGPYALVMSGRSDLFFWDNAGAAALNLILSLVLAPRYGVTGAALASVLSTTALQVVLAIQVLRVVRIHPFQAALAKPLLAAAVALAVELLVGHAPVPTAARIPLVVVSGAVTYAATLLALRPGEEERRFVMRIVDKLLGRRSGGDGDR